MVRAMTREALVHANCRGPYATRQSLTSRFDISVGLMRVDARTPRCLCTATLLIFCFCLEAKILYKLCDTGFVHDARTNGNRALDNELLAEKGKGAEVYKEPAEKYAV